MMPAAISPWQPYPLDYYPADYEHAWSDIQIRRVDLPGWGEALRVGVTPPGYARHASYRLYTGYGPEPGTRTAEPDVYVFVADQFIEYTAWCRAERDAGRYPLAISPAAPSRSRRAKKNQP